MSQNVEQNAPLRITISEVRGLLDLGKNRKQIADHYGKSMAEMQRTVWSHPKLKNLKAKKQYTGIELEDDTEDALVAEVNTQITDAVTQTSSIEDQPQVEEVVETTEETWR
jgi:hypothetical protein